MNKEKIISKIVVGIIIMLPLTLTFLAGYSIGRHSAKNTGSGLSKDTEWDQATISQASSQEDDEESKSEYVYFRKSMPTLGKSFNDMPEKHLAAASQIGLKSIPLDRSDVKSKGLVKIDDCKYYKVDELKHSIPYLTKPAAKELANIGKRFQEILSVNNLPCYKIIVTSVLRTQEDIKRLRRSGNVNASQNSVHCFGCTFDISYVNYEKVENGDKRLMDSYELKKVLAQAMLAEKDAGKIFVKYERKQPCFHTTVRPF